MDAYKKDASRIAKEEDTEIVREIIKMYNRHTGLQLTRREMDIIYIAVKIAKKLFKKESKGSDFPG